MSSLAVHAVQVIPHSCFILATNELDNTQWSSAHLLDHYKVQSQAERGFRCLKDPSFLAAFLYRKKPEHIMASLMVMMVCLLVSTALEYHLKQVAALTRISEKYQIQTVPF